MTFRSRRDDTPVPGKQTVNYNHEKMISKSTLFVIEKAYHKVLISNEDIEKITNPNQFMIVDIGCPRSLMGINEFNIFKESQVIKEQGNMKVNQCFEKFKFGPSKPYVSNFRVEVDLVIEDLKLRANFFVVE